MSEQYYRLPIEQWEANYLLEIENKKASSAKFSTNYIPHHTIQHLFRKHCPHLAFMVHEITPIGSDDEATYLIICGLVEVATGLQTPKSYCSVHSHGASRHEAIVNPDARQIADSLKRAFVKVVAEETGIGFSMWAELDLDPYDEAEEVKTKAKSSKRKSKDEDDEEDEAPFDLDFHDTLDDDDDDDDELEQPRRRSTRRTTTTKRGRR